MTLHPIGKLKETKGNLVLSDNDQYLIRKHKT